TGPSCRPLCPLSGCPSTFTTDPAKVCPSNSGVGQPVTFYTGCNGFELIWYNGVDTADALFYRSSDGSFVSYSAISFIFGGMMTCVPGVPSSFTIDSCSSRTTIVCGH